MFRRSGIGVVVFLALLFAAFGCSEGETPEDASTNPDGATETVERAESETTRMEAAREVAGVDLVLSGGALIDGTGAPPVENAVVAVDEGKIVAVGRAEDVEDFRGAETYDASGETILPGFVNAHAHSRDISLEETKEWARAGVATVRDLAGPEDEMVARREETSGDPEYPELLVSGPMITVPGGHPFPIYGPNYPALAVNGPEDAESEVNRLLDAGVDHIKIVASGRADSGWPELSDAEIRAITETAHARDTRVSVHVDAAAGLRRAALNGVDDAAHSPRDTIPDDLISLMVERDVALVPTIDVYQTIAEANGTAAEWNATTLPVMYDNLRRFEAAGGTLALGDDYGGYPGVELGMMTDEMEHWLAAGLTPMRVITAAAEGSATASGIEDETGTLEEGKAADILVVDGDPLADIRALERPSLVMNTTGSGESGAAR